MKFIALRVIMVTICAHTSFQDMQSNSMAKLETEMKQIRMEMEKMKKFVNSLILCEDNWVDFEGSCYLFQRNAYKWNEAKAFCADRGGTLAIVDNSREEAFIETQLTDLGIPGVMLGLSDHDHEGTFTWVDGSPITFNKFPTGKPNDYEGKKEHVAIAQDGINFVDQKYKWVTRAIFPYGRPLCEKKKKQLH